MGKLQAAFTERVASVGIDVSKAKLDVALLAEGQGCQMLQVSNDPLGLKCLIKKLKTQGIDVQAVPCVLESTGDYHLLSALTLAKAGFIVKCVNPLITKRYQKTGIRTSKTDRADAKLLAEIGLLRPELPSFTDTPMLVLKRKGVSLLSKLETTKQQLRAALERFEETQAMLKLPFDLKAIRKGIAQLDLQMDVIRQFLQQEAPSEVKALAKLPGVTEKSAAVLLSALEGKQFENRDQLVAFVGLDVVHKQSGTWQGKEKLSKKGSPYLRKLLYQMAWGLKNFHPVYQAYYHKKYKQEGCHYSTALLAVARKFLRFLFAFYWKKSIPLDFSV